MEVYVGLGGGEGGGGGGGGGGGSSGDGGGLVADVRALAQLLLSLALA